MKVNEITTAEAQQEENQNEQQDNRFQAVNTRFKIMEKHMKSLTWKILKSLIGNNMKRKYDDKDDEKRRKKARLYVERQILPSQQRGTRQVKFLKMIKLLLSQGYVA